MDDEENYQQHIQSEEGSSPIACTQGLEQALPLGLLIDSDKNLQTKGDVVLLY